NYSRKDATSSIEDYFRKQKIIAISDVDTRAVVRHIRSKGAMNAIISSETTDIAKLKKELAKCPPMEGLELSSKVTCKKPYTYGNVNAQYKVAVLDYGVKINSLRSLTERDCYVKVFPSTTPFSE